MSMRSINCNCNCNWNGGLFPFRIKNSGGFGGGGGADNNNNKAAAAAAAADDKKKKNNNNSIPKQAAPRLTSQVNSQDIDFQQRLNAIKRSALEQKKAQDKKQFGAIDYDSPISISESDNKTISFATKVGIGVAVPVFALVFALGDFLPSGSPNEDNIALVNDKLSDMDKTALQSRLKEFEATLSNSPRDPTALEGAAVTLAELGEYARAASLLDDLTKEKPNDADAFRLLGEVKYELKDYEGSIAAYKSSAKVSEDIKFEVLRGLTNSLLAAKKPDEAVQLLLACRERLSSEDLSKKTDSSPTDSQKLDPIQVELLLGKAYSDWGHVGDAIAIYDQLISTHPDDFRGYLAKGIILKENKNIGDAERMFIQARFFAPDKAKALVDRYSR
ncbi:TPR domain protein [Medicago truncatula]|uniref:TPR domain protein n=2 Tax=Medicago truncatula TaxID=3880 RepID=A0A072UFI4_MEDTR|nr:TPR domain protein [Medicago truncatula]